jgi:hypothetical protein
MARYFLRFRHSDTGLTPVFTGGTFFKKASDLTLVTPPAIGEVGNGSYYFDYTPTFDIIFEVDGGASIPTEEVRYISDTISPKDIYIDEPTSQVKDDVWNDVVDRAGGTKGDYVEKLPGIETAVGQINTETDPTNIANAVWDAATAGNIGVGSMGELLNNAASGSAPSAAVVAAAVWDKALSSHVLPGSFGQTLQLLNNDTAGAGSSTTITLGASAVGTLDFYKNALLVITGGTGAGQARAITAYTALKVATVDRAWGVIPNNTSQYIVIPSANTPVDSAGIADAVWDEALAGHLIVGSTGEKLDSGSGGGGGVSFLANGDSANPFIVQVASPKHTQVKITFSEPVEMTVAANGALNLANYSIPGLTLIAVSSLTAQQVLLTTSAQTPDFLYSLSVINVEDLSGNPIL